MEGGWNFSGVQNKDLDRLLEAQRAEYDLAKRKTLVNEIQDWVYRESPWLVIVNQDELQAYNKAEFAEGVIPKVSGFNDPRAFFTLKPRGARKLVRWASPISDLKTINPVLSSESSQIRILYLAYDTLVKYGPDTKPGPWAATGACVRSTWPSWCWERPCSWSSTASSCRRSSQWPTTSRSGAR